MPLRVTRLEICLQASAIELITVASSLSMLPFCSSCGGRAGEPGLSASAARPTGGLCAP